MKVSSGIVIIEPNIFFNDASGDGKRLFELCAYTKMSKMNEQFTSHINAIMQKPAPRSATYWRAWAAQTDLPLSDREGILQSFNAYVLEQTANQEIVSASIEIVGTALESFWSVVDACAAEKA